MTTPPADAPRPELDELIELAREFIGNEIPPFQKYDEYVESHVTFAAEVQSRTRQEREQELAVANQIGDTFWLALKELNLAEIDVQNPGQHVTDLIRDKKAADVRLSALAAHVQGLQVEYRGTVITKFSDKYVKLDEVLKLLAGTE